jgi:hypothetical protein
VTYHHLGREDAHDDQVDKIKSDFQKAFPDGRVCTYHLRRGTARVYVLCVREEHLPKMDSIPAIKPLIMTKDAWAKGGKDCQKDHSAKSAPTGLLPSPPVVPVLDAEAPSKGYTVKASKKSTTSTGYINRKGQVVVRHTGLSGTDHGQSVYQLGCSHCGHVYGANGSDIHLRKCPNCQDGAAGLPMQ